MARLTESRLKALLLDIRRGTELAFGDRLEGVFLFGSYARGEADDESDVDILVVLEECGSYSKAIAAVSELISRVSLEYGVAVTPVFVSGEDWRSSRGFFVATVREEAVAA